MTTAQKAKLKEQKTEFVGLKEFRQGISNYAVKANKKNFNYIILKRNVPILHVRPLTKKETIIAQLEADVAHAREDVRLGRTYTTEQVRKMLGLS